ncbi:hypothetical protein F5Y06DRAFT_258314 [Hypoxylon sp. FL0890]|nr:hypothetical protein F5Y06DRAFT_258314 [Hypoxylon sp. FL0890]
MSSSDASAPVESEAKVTSASAADVNRRPISSRDNDGDHHKEKLPVEEAVEVNVDLEKEDDPEISQIPLEVRRVVSLHDNTTLPTLAFRYFLLSVIFVIPEAFVSAMNSFRTTYEPYSVFFVQIASNYVGL